MNKRVLFFGLVMIILGALLLARTLDLLIFGFRDFFEVFIPLAFIGVGVWLILRKRKQEQLQNADMQFHDQVIRNNISPAGAQPPPGAGPTMTEEPKPGKGKVSETPRYDGGKARYSGFLGDMFIDCANINLQNVEISAFIVDVEVKLHGADLQPGLSRMVVSGFIGDIRVLVPKGMAVFANGSSFIGDMEIFGRRSSGFGNNIDGQSENYQTADSKLYIAINSFIGDIRVYEV
jgi:lia operon protein LiaF